MKTDVYDQVTQSIIAALEAGVQPWFKPWSADHAAGRITRPLRANGVAYRGINVLMLWGVAVERGYAAPLWLTFKQAKDLGGQVRRGEKGSLVVYANRITRSETDETSGEEIERAIPFLKSYSVFNAEQVDGLPAHFYTMAAPALSTFERIEAADRFFAATGAEVRHGGNQAYYTVSDDRVQMPPFEAFQDQISYYATLAHELTHWTKHTKRLDRDFGRKSWGDAGYAMEELVAELGAAFLAADLGLEAAPRADHAAYIASWLKVLKDDKRAIFSAAAHAQRAVDFMLAMQTGTAEDRQNSEAA